MFENELPEYVREQICSRTDCSRTIDRLQVNTIHFRDRIETLNHSSIRLKCMISLRGFKVLQESCKSTVPDLHFYCPTFTRSARNLRFPLCFPRLGKGSPRPFTQVLHPFTQFLHSFTEFSCEPSEPCVFLCFPKDFRRAPLQRTWIRVVHSGPRSAPLDLVGSGFSQNPLFLHDFRTVLGKP